MPEPIVSICCLTYNHATLLKDAMEGFLMQRTTFPFEIVIHDDASTDGTADLVREYVARYPDKIRPIFQKENQFSKDEIYPFWSHLYPAARGKYIAECDGDDYWTDPAKLQKQHDFMESHPECSMCHHDYLIKEMRTDGGMHVPTRTPPRSYTAEELIAFDGIGYSIHTSTKFWRNVYDPARHAAFAPFWGDHPLTTMMGMYGGCGYVPGIRPSVFRHAHKGSSWCLLPPKAMHQKVMEMYRRINGAIEATGNKRWIDLRKGFR